MRQKIVSMTVSCDLSTGEMEAVKGKPTAYTPHELRMSHTKSYDTYVRKHATRTSLAVLLALVESMNSTNEYHQPMSTLAYIAEMSPAMVSQGMRVLLDCDIVRKVKGKRYMIDPNIYYKYHAKYFTRVQDTWNALAQ